jgi:hypothetical protein
MTGANRSVAKATEDCRRPKGSTDPWLFPVRRQLLKCASPLALSELVREPERPENKVLH